MTGIDQTHAFLLRAVEASEATAARWKRAAVALSKFLGKQAEETRAMLTDDSRDLHTLASEIEKRKAAEADIEQQNDCLNALFAKAERAREAAVKVAALHRKSAKEVATLMDERERHLLAMWGTGGLMERAEKAEARVAALEDALAITSDALADAMIDVDMDVFVETPRGYGVRVAEAALNVLRRRAAAGAGAGGEKAPDDVASILTQEEAAAMCGQTPISPEEAVRIARKLTDGLRRFRAAGETGGKVDA